MIDGQVLVTSLVVTYFFDVGGLYGSSVLSLSAPEL